MCHRYQYRESQKLLAEFDIAVNAAIATACQELELFPTKSGPVIVPTSEDYHLELYEWGLLPFFWKPSGRSKSRNSFQRNCFNARSETAHKKPSFRQAFAKRRCLVPATEFFEKDHWFSLTSGDAFCFAGLWEHWQGDGEEVYSYTFLTTEPNEMVAGVGHHRMPVLLHMPEQRSRWLNPDIEERGPLEELFRPADPELLDVRPHSA